MFFYYIVDDYLTAYNNTIKLIMYTSLFLSISYAINDAYDMY